MPVIEIHNVSKTFPHAAERMLLRGHILRWFSRTKTEPFFALRNVSFSVERGQSLAVVGHNGAGKSTLLSLVAGVAQPSDGSVKVDGRIAALLELGSGFHPDLTGSENLILNASLIGLNRKETVAKYDQIVDFSGLGDFIDEPLRTYSTGMMMRLAFSVAIHADPQIVILDEVLAVGDAEFQAKCRTAIEGLRSAGRTLLFVSHAAAEVRRMCDRAVWLDHGRMMMDGPAGEVIDAYEGRLAGQVAR
jgi:ABC-type polysaccharide/polyol phosphate transport system ATPase subunit